MKKEDDFKSNRNMNVNYLRQGVTKSYKRGSERQKINYEAINGRNLTKITRHGVFPSQIQVWDPTQPPSWSKLLICAKSG